MITKSFPFARVLLVAALFTLTLFLAASPASAQSGNSSNAAILARVLEIHHKKTEECDANTIGIEASEVVDLGEAKRMVMVSCAVGAYQTYWMMYLVEIAGGKPNISLLKFRGTNDGQNFYFDDGLTMPEWAAGEKSLISSYRGRGIGDCGASAEYRWNGKKFILQQASYLACCPRNEKDFNADPKCKGRVFDEDPLDDYGIFPLVYQRPQ